MYKSGGVGHRDTGWGRGGGHRLKSKYNWGGHKFDYWQRASQHIHTAHTHCTLLSQPVHSLVTPPHALLSSQLAQAVVREVQHLQAD